MKWRLQITSVIFEIIQGVPTSFIILNFFVEKVRRIDKSSYFATFYYDYFECFSNLIYHSVWNSLKRSHSTLRAKRATFTFWVDKSWLKIPKIVNYGEFLKTWSLRSNSLVRQVTFNRTKMPKLKNLSAVFCVICKLCALAQFLSFWSLWRLWLSNVAHLQLFPAVRTRTSYCRYFFKSDTMGNHSSNTRNEGNWKMIAHLILYFM